MALEQAFEKHAAYMAQAWRTLEDSVLLKEQNSRVVGYHSSDETRRPPPPRNIARIVANNPDAADRRHCQSQGCQAMVKPGNSYCAACLERDDATDAQGITGDGNYGTGRNQ